MVLSIQLLPIRQMASWLLTNQVTEEIVHAKADSKCCPDGDELHKHFTDERLAYLLAPLTVNINSIHPQDEALVALHHDDIPTPPPNC